MTRLALLVGEGDIAASALNAVCNNRAYDPIILSMQHAAGAFDGRVDVGDPNTLIEQLRGLRVDAVCAVGYVDLDAPRRAAIAQFVVSHAGGKIDPSDMGIELAYQLIAKEARAEILGVHQVCPEMIAGTGILVGQQPDITASQLDHIVRSARAVARTDLGQSMVFDGERPIAAEDALGTDSLIERAGEIALGHNLSSDRFMLVKVAKPQQSGIADLPSIGPKTIENCAKAGVKTIVVEGDKCLIALRQKTLDAAKEQGISVFGWG